MASEQVASGGELEPPEPISVNTRMDYEALLGLFKLKLAPHLPAVYVQTGESTKKAEDKLSIRGVQIPFTSRTTDVTKVKAKRVGPTQVDIKPEDLDEYPLAALWSAVCKHLVAQAALGRPTLSGRWKVLGVRVKIALKIEAGGLLVLSGGRSTKVMLVSQKEIDKWVTIKPSVLASFSTKVKREWDLLCAIIVASEGGKRLKVEGNNTDDGHNDELDLDVEEDTYSDWEEEEEGDVLEDSTKSQLRSARRYTSSSSFSSYYSDSEDEDDDDEDADDEDGGKNQQPDSSGSRRLGSRAPTTPLPPVTLGGASSTQSSQTYTMARARLKGTKPSDRLEKATTQTGRAPILTVSSESSGSRRLGSRAPTTPPPPVTMGGASSAQSSQTYTMAGARLKGTKPSDRLEKAATQTGPEPILTVSSESSCSRRLGTPPPPVTLGRASSAQSSQTYTMAGARLKRTKPSDRLEKAATQTGPAPRQSPPRTPGLPAGDQTIPQVSPKRDQAVRPPLRSSSGRQVECLTPHTPQVPSVSDSSRTPSVSVSVSSRTSSLAAPIVEVKTQGSIIYRKKTLQQTKEQAMREIIRNIQKKTKENSDKRFMWVDKDKNGKEKEKKEKKKG